jgi:hypothetical protein
MRQIRRAKPTFGTAHEYHRAGSFGTGPEHWVDDKERQAMADEVGDELLELVKTQFPRTQNLEYAILKAHLIVEHSLVQYIRCMSRLLVDPSELRRFTFAQKFEIARLLGFGANDPVIIPTVERLNKVRNQVAHSFALDRPLLDEMIRVNSADYEDFAMANDRERIRRLRWICFAIAGRTAGEVSANAYMSGRASHALRRALGGE